MPVRRGSLQACELDADSALARWLNRRRPALASILERGTWLDRDDVESFLDLALPGVDELLGLIEIERLGGGDTYDRVVVDTAPTGHTLRLLATPSMFSALARVLDLMQEKHRVLAAALGRGSRADASEALIDEIRENGERLDTVLRDPSRTRICWVSLPEELAIAESERAISSLRAEGMRVSDVLINRVTPPPPSACALCDGRRRAESDAMRGVPARLGNGSTRISIVPAQDEPARGIAALRALARTVSPLDLSPLPVKRRPAVSRRAVRPNSILARLVDGPSTRLLLVGGKGGVGKTTCATTLALAVARADPQRRLLLLSTDPAHSIADALGHPVGDIERRVRGGPANLAAREIDAASGWQERCARYRATVGGMFDAASARSRAQMAVDRAIIEELFALAPPGMDEITGMLTITETVLPDREASRFDLVIVDTAPTGHALRLLAAPGQAKAWVRQFMKVALAFEGIASFGALASELLSLGRGLDRLQRLLISPRSCGFVVVARPERLPVVETVRLIEWLRTHDVARRALVVNGLTPPGCSRCQRAAAREQREMSALVGHYTKGRSGMVVQTDAVAPPPIGARELERWARTWKLPNSLVEPPERRRRP
jgi:arsenite-transporting ATPase